MAEKGVGWVNQASQDPNEVSPTKSLSQKATVSWVNDDRSSSGSGVSHAYNKADSSPAAAQSFTSPRQKWNKARRAIKLSLNVSKSFRTLRDQYQENEVEASTLTTLRILGEGKQGFVHAACTLTWVRAHVKDTRPSQACNSSCGMLA